MDIKDNENKKEVAQQGINALQSFIKDELLLPVHLSEIGIYELPIEAMVEKATHGAASLPRAYRELTKQDCECIYKMCL